MRKCALPPCSHFVPVLSNKVLELTHNHGTETQKGPTYHSGNADDMGFGHIGTDLLFVVVVVCVCVCVCVCVFFIKAFFGARESVCLCIREKFSLQSKGMVQRPSPC